MAFFLNVNSGVSIQAVNTHTHINPRRYLYLRIYLTRRNAVLSSDTIALRIIYDVHVHPQSLLLKRMHIYYVNASPVQRGEYYSAVRTRGAQSSHGTVSKRNRRYRRRVVPKFMHAARVLLRNKKIIVFNLLYSQFTHTGRRKKHCNRNAIRIL